jgi:hypothetical protein
MQGRRCLRAAGRGMFVWASWTAASRRSKPDAAAGSGRRAPRHHRRRHAEPAQPRLPARYGGHWRKRRGPGSDTFWSVAQGHVPLRARHDARRCRGGRRQLYVEMLEAGFGRVGEFHYLHHDKDGGHYAISPRWPCALRRQRASETGIALTLLPVFYAHAGFGGTAPGEGQRRFINDRRVWRGCWSACRKAADRYAARRRHRRRHRTACAPSRRRSLPTSWPWPAMRRSTSTSPSR